MVNLGARVSLAPDCEPEAYGATPIIVHDAAGREVRSEGRGRELELLDIVQFVELDDGERVASAPDETKLIARLGWSAVELREEVRRIVYDDGDRWPAGAPMAGLERRGVSADGAALAALPLVLECDDEVIAQYAIQRRAPSRIRRKTTVSIRLGRSTTQTPLLHARAITCPACRSSRCDP
jgi:hypothetical protein